MVGNDVVDLSDRDADPETLHPRFDQRVFAKAELDSLRASQDPVRLRWQLWASKEAAYKAVVKAHPGIVFSPSSFRVKLERSLPEMKISCGLDGCTVEVGEEIEDEDARVSGAVACSAGSCRVDLTESFGVIHAVARFEEPQHAGAPPRAAERRMLLQGWDRPGFPGADPDAPSRAVRELACSGLASMIGVEAGDLEIRRHGRVPQFWLAGSAIDVDLSLSHHGAVVGYACEIPTCYLALPRAEQVH